jgi:hypothetical protein
MLKIEYVRDGKSQIVGSKTTGFANGDTVARDHDGRIVGHSNNKFSTTRDSNAQIRSSNQADVESLFDW